MGFRLEGRMGFRLEGSMNLRLEGRVGFRLEGRYVFGLLLSPINFMEVDLTSTILRSNTEHG